MKVCFLVHKISGAPPPPPNYYFVAKDLGRIQQIYIFYGIFIKQFLNLNDLHSKHLQSYDNSKFSVLAIGRF